MSDARSEAASWSSPRGLMSSDVVERVLAAAFAVWVLVRTWGLLAAGWGAELDEFHLTLRYAENLAAGHGAVWTPGEAEPPSYPSRAWVELARRAMDWGYPPLFVARTAAVLGLLSACLASYVIARRFVGPLLAVLPAFFLTGSEQLLVWTLSGLETSAFVAFGLGAIACLLVALGYRRVDLAVGSDLGGAGDSPRPLAMAGALACCVGAHFTRAEGASFVLVVGAGLVFHLANARVMGAGRAARSVAVAALVAALGFAVLVATLSASSLTDWLEPASAVGCSSELSTQRGPSASTYWTYVCVGMLALLLWTPRALDARHVLVWLVPGWALLTGADGFGSEEGARHFALGQACLWIVFVVSLGRGLGLVAPRLARSLGACGLTALSLLAVLWLGLEAKPEEMEERLQRRSERVAADDELSKWIVKRAKPGWLVVTGRSRIAHRTGLRAFEPGCGFDERGRARFVGDVESASRELLLVGPEVLVVPSRHPKEAEPGPDAPGFRALVAQLGFAKRYRKQKHVGEKESTWHTFVYLRQDLAKSKRKKKKKKKRKKKKNKKTRKK